MKVLFLDIDGVLNPFSGHSRDLIHDRHPRFSGAAVKNLKSLMKEESDLKIVISSAWRHLGMEKLKEIFEANDIDSTRIVGLTGYENGPRGHQIQCYLDRNPEVKHFAILDDNSDMADLLTKLVKTSSWVGLTSKQVLQVIETIAK